MALTQTDIKLLKKAFATKEDLKAFATKKDLMALATKMDLEDLRDELDEKFRGYRDEIMTALDGIAKELSDSRDERIIQSHQLSRQEDRILALEKIHPGGSHAHLTA